MDQHNHLLLKLLMLLCYRAMRFVLKFIYKIAKTYINEKSIHLGATTYLTRMVTVQVQLCPMQHSPHLLPRSVTCSLLTERVHVSFIPFLKSPPRSFAIFFFRIRLSAPKTVQVESIVAAINYNY